MTVYGSVSHCMAAFGSVLKCVAVRGCKWLRVAICVPNGCLTVSVNLSPSVCFFSSELR